MSSVQAWASLRGWNYQLVGDEIFDLTPDWYREKTAGRLPIQTDLGRLILARSLLAEGYERVVWLDADALVFNPNELTIDITDEFAFGREVWVQYDKKGQLKAYKNAHNALCVFTQGNSFLDFYIYTAQAIIKKHQGGLAPQIVGPKLLTSLHNTIGFPLIDDVGMLSPLVMKDVVNGGGAALDLLKQNTPTPMKAANLSSSLDGQETDLVEVNEALFEQVCQRLTKTGSLDL
ncbi:MAG: hypothetical protein OQK35_05505 [Alphaproteobacteria bacterium]|nr:hypothetical protein [Alphaproteobacteria bacterium]